MVNVSLNQMVYEIVQSFNPGTNAPVTGATFDLTFFIDGSPSAAVVPNVYLTNPSAATYTVSWSSSTVGIHQFYIKNSNTNVTYISEVYNVLTDATQPVIYVGL